MQALYIFYIVSASRVYVVISVRAETSVQEKSTAW